MSATGVSMVRAELVWDCRCRLGEGAVWNALDASLYFVDIKGREVLAFTPQNGAQRRWALPQMIGWLVPRQSGGWLAGFQSGVAALQLEPELRIDWLHRLHAEASPMRLNDAKADARGRLWFGSMNDTDETRPDGNFYRCSASLAPVLVDSGYGVTNGPAFSPDGRTLYHTDCAASTIYAFDVSPAGDLSGKRTWAKFGADEGYPDGMTTDAGGDVWVAHWAGSRVTRRDSAGRVVGIVQVEAPRVTNVAFGGPHFGDLYITTARAGLDDASLAQAPHSGGLFVARDVGLGAAPGTFGG